MKNKFLPVILLGFASLGLAEPAAVPAKKIVGASIGEATAATAEAKPATPADTAWKDVGELLKGPRKQPKSQEEAETVYAEFLKEFDEKSSAFLKEFPKDPRRFQLDLMEVRISGLRKGIQKKEVDEKAIEAKLDAIVASEEADAETRATASFIRVMKNREDANFKELADAHMKKFPDFKANSQLQGQLKSLEAMAEIKTKPLDITFKAIDDREVDLSKMRGKVVLIDFWATWCGPCVAEIPNVLKTYESLHDKGFEIVGISFDQDKAKLEAMTKDQKMPWAQYFDGKGWQNEFGKKYGITSIPAMWLVNKKGMVVDTNGREDLEAKVTKLLAESEK